MRKTKRRIFVIVAELQSRRVQTIIEGPDEKKIAGRAIGQAIERRVNQLAVQFSPTAYDITITYAHGINDLRNAYPEFSGWEQAKSESLA